MKKISLHVVILLALLITFSVSLGADKYKLPETFAMQKILHEWNTHKPFAKYLTRQMIRYSGRILDVLDVQVLVVVAISDYVTRYDEETESTLRSKLEGRESELVEAIVSASELIAEEPAASNDTGNSNAPDFGQEDNEDESIGTKFPGLDITMECLKQNRK